MGEGKAEGGGERVGPVHIDCQQQGKKVAQPSNTECLQPVCSLGVAVPKLPFVRVVA